MSVVDPAMPALVTETEILLVEDDPGDAVLVQACLFEVGVEDASITWVRTLAEARAELAGRSIGCVLLDLGLPDASGYGGVHALVEVAPDVAIIVLTGRQERDGVDALGAGAQDYLVKDELTGQHLERSIRYAVERKRAHQARQQLVEARLSAAEQARLERGLLPVPLLRGTSIGCATYYRAGRNNAVLGGDFFDVIEMPDGRVRAIIGDVMGHGPDEAALGVHLRVAWRALLLAGVDDERILPSLAELLRAEAGASHFVTACEVTVERDAMSVRVAGHPAPIVAAGGTARYLDVPVGPPLGVAGLPQHWPLASVPLPESVSIVLYSDGLLDAYAPDLLDGGIGVPQLVEAVSRSVELPQPATAWVPELVARAPRESFDDTAVVVLTTASPG